MHKDARPKVHLTVKVASNGSIFVFAWQATGFRIKYGMTILVVTYPSDRFPLSKEGDRVFYLYKPHHIYAVHTPDVVLLELEYSHS